MRIELIKTYKSLHTWTGILTGLFLYIAFVAGAFTMFKAPLNQWALQAENTLPAIPQSRYDELIEKVLQEHPEARQEFTVNLPTSFPQSSPLTWMVEENHTPEGEQKDEDEHDHHAHNTIQWQASLDERGQLITQQVSLSKVGSFLDDLHRTAGIPGGSGHDAFGTYVLGIVSALYFIALVSGLVVFLPTWFKDLMSLRRGKNRKRYWLDFHNILGITSLPFHLVIAFTAFVFAYHDPIYGSLKVWIYGDQPMFERPAQVDNTSFSSLASLEQIEQSIEKLEPEFVTAQLVYSGLDTPRPQLRIGGFTDGEMARGAEYSFLLGNPYTGDIPYISMLPSHLNNYSQFVVGFFTLHFGSYGGQTIRWIYFGLGIAGALLFLTGNILWIEARRKRQKKAGSTPEQTRSSQVMAKLTVGVSLGTLMGITLALLSAKWLPHSQVDIELWQQSAYYTGFLISLLWAFINKPMQAARQLLLVCSTCVFLIPVSTLLFSHAIPAGLAFSTTDFMVNLVAVSVSLSLVLVYRKLRQRESVIEADSVWV